MQMLAASQLICDPGQSPENLFWQANMEYDTADSSMELPEMMQIMDVATSLRKEKEVAKQQFDFERNKNQLKEKLLRTAALTGEELTPEQLEAAINWYYEKLHKYQDPPKSLTWYLAHLYIRRNQVFLVAMAITFGVILIYWNTY